MQNALHSDLPDVAGHPGCQTLFVQTIAPLGGDDFLPVTTGKPAAALRTTVTPLYFHCPEIFMAIFAEYHLALQLLGGVHVHPPWRMPE